jgi:hypothetical protein
VVEVGLDVRWCDFCRAVVEVWAWSVRPRLLVGNALVVQTGKNVPVNGHV